jgi:hypothetical protein
MGDAKQYLPGNFEENGTNYVSISLLDGVERITLFLDNSRGSRVMKRII